MGTAWKKRLLTKAPEGYLSISEMAELCGLEKNTVYCYVRLGFLPSIRRGSAIFIDARYRLRWTDTPVEREETRGKPRNYEVIVV